MVSCLSHNNWCWSHFRASSRTCLALQLKRYKQMEARIAGASQTFLFISISLSMVFPCGLSHMWLQQPDFSQNSFMLQMCISQRESEVGRPIITFYNLTSDVTKCHFLHLVFVRAMLIMPAPIQGEENFTPLLDGKNVKYLTDK